MRTIPTGVKDMGCCGKGLQEGKLERPMTGCWDLPNELVGMEGSGIRRIFDKKAEMIRGGVPQAEMCGLEIGQPDYQTPRNVLDAIARAALESRTGYTPNRGIIELRTAVADYLRSFYGLDYNPETEISITCGGMGALNYAYHCLKKDQVTLVPMPFYPNYLMALDLDDRPHAFYKYRIVDGDRLEPDMESVQEAIRNVEKSGGKVGAIIVNSPSNPTGAVFSRSVMEQLVSLGKPIISDECYDRFVYEGSHCSPAQINRDAVLLCGSASKSYAMPGERIGWIAGPGLTRESPLFHVHKTAEAFYSCPPQTCQWGGVEAFNGPQDEVERMKAGYKERRDAVLEVLKAGGLKAIRPEGAFYVWVNISEARVPSLQYAVGLLESRHVAVAPGETFGDDNYVRLSLCQPVDKLTEGARRLVEYHKGL